MLRRLFYPLAMIAVLVVGGCAFFGIDTGVRSLVIRQHRLVPAQLQVPAGQPVTLLVDVVDYRPVSIASTDLGIANRFIRNNRPRPLASTAAQFNLAKRARIPIGPLSPGQYEIQCDCHGKVALATIVVTPPVSAARPPLSPTSLGVIDD